MGRFCVCVPRCDIGMIAYGSCLWVRNVGHKDCTATSGLIISIENCGFQFFVDTVFDWARQCFCRLADTGGPEESARFYLPQVQKSTSRLIMYDRHQITFLSMQIVASRSTTSWPSTAFVHGILLAAKLSVRIVTLSTATPRRLPTFGRYSIIAT